MNAGPNRWIGSAIVFLFVTGAASALTVMLTVDGPTPTAQAGVPYSSALTLHGGAWPSLQMLTYGIRGSLPPGLSLNSSTGAITGTPTAAGTYAFGGWISGLVVFGYAHYDAVGEAQFTITVLPLVASAPTSPWTLALLMVGLAGVGFLRLRQRSLSRAPLPARIDGCPSKTLLGANR
jgi:hypothetical protein